MTKEDIASLTLRLLAIHCFLLGLSSVEHAAYFLLQRRSSATSDAASMLPILATTAMIPVASLLLLLYARPLGRCLAGPQPQTILSERWTNKQVQLIAFCVAGAYLIASNLPDVLTWGEQTMYISTKRFSQAGVYASMIRPLPWYMMLDEIAAAALGWWLLLGSTGWIGAWHRVRKAGRPGA